MVRKGTGSKMKRLVFYTQHIVTRVLLVVIEVYRLFVSPLLGTNCRHLPTCSQYAKDAVIMHGPLCGYVAVSMCAYVSSFFGQLVRWLRAAAFSCPAEPKLPEVIALGALLFSLEPFLPSAMLLNF